MIMVQVKFKTHADSLYYNTLGDLICILSVLKQFTCRLQWYIRVSRLAEAVIELTSFVRLPIGIFVPMHWVS
jgi:hypothetical protein